MAAKRSRWLPDEGLTEYERGLRALQNVPLSDEDPAGFWGPDWQQKLAESDADIAAGRIERFESDEEFLKALGALAAESAAEGPTQRGSVPERRQSSPTGSADRRRR